MRRNLFVLLFILMIMPLAAQHKPILTVMDFRNGAVSDSEMRAVVSQLSHALFKTGKYKIIDSSQRDMLLKEIDFSLSDCTDESCQLQAGMQLSAEFIVVGELEKAGSVFPFPVKCCVQKAALCKAQKQGSILNWMIFLMI